MVHDYPVRDCDAAGGNLYLPCFGNALAVNYPVRQSIPVFHGYELPAADDRRVFDDAGVAFHEAEQVYLVCHCHNKLFDTCYVNFY